MEIEEFLPEVYLDAPGVPEVVALNALRNTLREFCRVSGVWRAELDPVSPKADTAEYDLDAPFGAEIIRAQSVRYGGCDLPVMSASELDAGDSGWRTRTGTAVRKVLVEPRVLRLVPIPEVDDSEPVRVFVVLRPKTDATRCDDMLSRWNEAIAAGALARLKAMPNKPWTDRDAVKHHRSEFSRGMNAARGQVLRGFSEASLTVRPRRLGG